MAKYLNISVCVDETAQEFTLQLSADVMSKSVALDFSDFDAKFSDNWFDLIPDQTKTVTISRADLSRQVSKAELRDKLQITSVYDIRNE